VLILHNPLKMNKLLIQATGKKDLQGKQILIL